MAKYVCRTGQVVYIFTKFFGGCSSDFVQIEGEQ